MLGDYNAVMLIIKLFPVYRSLCFVNFLLHLYKENYIFKNLLCTKPLRSLQISGETSPLIQLDGAGLGAGCWRVRQLQATPGVVHTLAGRILLWFQLWTHICLTLEPITTLWYCLPGSLKLHNPGPSFLLTWNLESSILCPAPGITTYLIYLKLLEFIFGGEEKSTLEKEPQILRKNLILFCFDIPFPTSHKRTMLWWKGNCPCLLVPLHLLWLLLSLLPRFLVIRLSLKYSFFPRNLSSTIFSYSRLLQVHLPLACRRVPNLGLQLYSCP